MAEVATKMPIRLSRAGRRASTRDASHPVEQLRTEIDRLLSDFLRGYWHVPFRRAAVDVEPIWRGDIRFAATPAVDIVDKDDAYKLTAELPGVDEKQVEISFSNSTLTIEGKKTKSQTTLAKITLYRSVAMAISTAAFASRMAWIRISSRPASRTVCSTLRCRKQPRHAESIKRSRSNDRKQIAGLNSRRRIQHAESLML